MEENTVRVNEIEEVDVDDEIEVEEDLERSGGSGFVAGFVGGILAYAAICGVKKLRAFITTKLAERRRKESSTDEVIDADYIEVLDKQPNSEEEASES